MFDDKNRGVGDFLLGAVVGGLVAGVTALLFAPQSGEKTRKDIADRAKETKEQADEYFEIAKGKGNEIYQNARETGEKYWSEVQTQAENVINQVNSSFKKETPTEDIKLSEEDESDATDEHVVIESPSINSDSSEESSDQESATSNETDQA